MFGHGRPSSLILALARSALALCAVLIGTLPGQEIATDRAPNIPPVNASPTASASESMHLRIAWGGGESRQWVGKAQLDRGALSNVELLGAEADAVGTAWLDGTMLRIGTLSPHKSDIVEITATAPSDALLLVELAAEAKATPVQAQVPLADLARRPYQLRLDDRGNTLEIALIPNPTLQITVKGDASQREALIFAPGQQLSFEMTLQLPAALHGTNVDIQTTLSPARRKDILWTDSQKLAVPVDGHPTLDLNVPLQQPDGVYTVHVKVSRPSGYFPNRFLAGAAAPLAERSFEVVVLDPQPAAPAGAARWVSVLELDPTNPGFMDRMPSWTQFRRIPGLNLNHGQLGSIRAGTVDLAMGRFIELPATAAGAEPHWQAYTLPLEAIGVPHLLEIDYPADEEQHFGLSIVEPNAVGVVEGVHRDAGVYVEGLGRSETKQKQTHHFLFWPRTQTPLLVVTNQHPKATAHFSQIRVLKRTGTLSAGSPAPASHDRLIAAYMRRPLTGETFGATKGVEVDAGGTPQSVDDGQTYYESAVRLADYLRYGGYNAAVISTPFDSRTNPPVAQLPITPIADAGRSLRGLRDVNGLELTFRVFDRERLTFMPAIGFATPLPQLEALRRAGDPRVTGVEWVGPDGRTWLEANGTHGGLASYYNLLDPRVQQAMLDVVREFVTRYGNHTAFGGLAIQLSGDGYAQLPPLEWGMDDATIARFEQARGIALTATGPNRFAARYEVLSSQYADEWRSWRAGQVAEFYGRLAAVVRGNTDRRLLLTTEKVFDHPQIAPRIRPSLPVENRVAPMLVDLGLDRKLLENIPGVVFCPTLYSESMTPLCDRTIDLELNAAFVRWREQPNSVAMPAAMLYHRPDQFQLASFKARSGLTFKAGDEFQLICEPLAYSGTARRSYLQSLLEGNPSMLVDGGDLLQLGQDEMLRTTRAIIAGLPTLAKISEVANQPVFVRTYAETNQSTIVVMNMSPWSVTAQVTLNVPQGAKLGPLAAPDGNSDNAPIKTLLLAAGQQPWAVTLEPYELQAVRIAAPGAKAVAVRADLKEAAHAELKAHLAELSNRDLSAQQEYRALANPSFEPLGGALLGWRSANPAATVQLDATAPQDGKTCLYMSSAGPRVVVQSDEFPTPATGQLAMTVFARGQNIGPGVDLRLIFQSERDGKIYPRAASVQGGSNGTCQSRMGAAVRYPCRRFAVRFSRKDADHF